MTPTTIEQARTMGFRPMTAKYSGKCDRCGGSITAGEAIFWRPGSTVSAKTTVHGSSARCGEFDPQHRIASEAQEQGKQLEPEVRAFCQRIAEHGLKEQGEKLGTRLGELIRSSAELAERYGLSWDVGSPALDVCNTMALWFVAMVGKGHDEGEAWMTALEMVGDRYESLAA